MASSDGTARAVRIASKARTRITSNRVKAERTCRTGTCGGLLLAGELPVPGLAVRVAGGWALRPHIGRACRRVMGTRNSVLVTILPRVDERRGFQERFAPVTARLGERFERGRIVAVLQLVHFGGFGKKLRLALGGID